LPAEAVAVTGFVLAGNTLLRPLVNWVNRRPIDEAATEAHYRVHATCDRVNVADVRDLLDESLSRFNYPIREIEVASESEDQVELAAHLVPTTADPGELDQVVSELEQSPLVLSSTWTVGTTS
jgi:putative Mg2+ transporter-C (MgtC) family protein